MGHTNELLFLNMLSVGERRAGNSTNKWELEHLYIYWIFFYNNKKSKKKPKELFHRVFVRLLPFTVQRAPSGQVYQHAVPSSSSIFLSMPTDNGLRRT